MSHTVTVQRFRHSLYLSFLGKLKLSLCCCGNKRVHMLYTCVTDVVPYLTVKYIFNNPIICAGKYK